MNGPNQHSRQGASGRSEQCLSDLEIERLASIPAGAPEASHVADCPVCRGRIEEVRRADEAFKHNVAPRLLPEIERRTAGPQTRRRIAPRIGWFPVAIGSVAMAAVAAVLGIWVNGLGPAPPEVGKAVGPPPPALPGTPPRAGEAIAPLVPLPTRGEGDALGGRWGPSSSDLPRRQSTKGAPSLTVHVRRGDRKFLLVKGAPLSPGDEIMLVPQPADYRWLLVVTVNSSGKAQVLHPWEGTRSAPVSGGAALPGAFQLDDKLGTEALVAFFSDEPLDAAAASEWAAKAAAEPEAKEPAREAKEPAGDGAKEAAGDGECLIGGKVAKPVVIAYEKRWGPSSGDHLLPRTRRTDTPTETPWETRSRASRERSTPGSAWTCAAEWLEMLVAWELDLHVFRRVDMADFGREYIGRDKRRAHHFRDGP